jgi:hypothetical protein
VGEWCGAWWWVRRRELWRWCGHAADGLGTISRSRSNQVPDGARGSRGSGSRIVVGDHELRWRAQLRVADECIAEPRAKRLTAGEGSRRLQMPWTSRAGGREDVV